VIDKVPRFESMCCALPALDCIQEDNRYLILPLLERFEATHKVV